MVMELFEWTTPDIMISGEYKEGKSRIEIENLETKQTHKFIIDINDPVEFVAIFQRISQKIKKESLYQIEDSLHQVLA